MRLFLVRVILGVELGLLIATTASSPGADADFFSVPFASRDSLHADLPPTTFLVVAPQDIQELCELAISRGQRPTPERHLFLEFKSRTLRQYVTLTLAQGLFNGCANIERIDFIQEQWRVTNLHQDWIDQWVVVADAGGTAHKAWHKYLLEDNGAILKEQILAVEDDELKATVDAIITQFLSSNLENRYNQVKTAQRHQ